MNLKKIVDERNRLIFLLLFYKTDSVDKQFFIKEIKKYNEIIGQEKKIRNEYAISSKSLNVQFEFFLKKFLENNTQDNLDKLKTKYLEMVKQHH